MSTPNKKYKDATIKLYLTSAPGRLIRLVNSIHGTNYPDDTEIKENTLDTPILMNVHNDLSFCYDNDVHLFLLEHQSTANENMALRMLIYLGRVYEKIIGSEKMYATKRFPIPTPHLVVLYNGLAPRPEIETFKLSEAFASLDADKVPAVEAIVTVYNINYDEGNMPELLKKNPELREYAEFIHQIRKHQEEGYDLGTALTMAVEDFCNTMYLGPFLEENASEVRNMIFGEWDTVTYGKVQRKEGREDAFVETIRNLMDSLGKSFDEVVSFMKLSAEDIAHCRPHFEK